MATIFISHSKRDEELVNTMAKVLRNIGHTPIIEEYIPGEQKVPIPYEEIRRNVNMSEYVFMFLTDNVVLTEYTKNWIMFEDGLAANGDKRLFVFERSGIPIPYPIPYLTDYMIFDADSTSDILDIQALAKKLGQIPTGVVGAGIGALLGLPFGPIGLILGGLGGGILGASAQEQIPRATCKFCGISFNYYSPHFYRFQCPSCRREITFSSGAIANE